MTEPTEPGSHGDGCTCGRTPTMVFLTMTPEDFMTIRDALEHMGQWGTEHERDRAAALLKLMPPNDELAADLMTFNEVADLIMNGDDDD